MRERIPADLLAWSKIVARSKIFTDSHRQMWFDLIPDSQEFYWEVARTVFEPDKEWNNESRRALAQFLVTLASHDTP